MAQAANTAQTGGTHTEHAASTGKQPSGKAQHSQKVKVGEQFTVSLPGTPSTGYTWMLRTLPAGVVLVSTDYKESDECKPGMTGCSGQQVFNFLAEKTGKRDIEFVYGRSWEKEWAKTQSEQVEIMDADK